MVPDVPGYPFWRQSETIRRMALIREYGGSSSLVIRSPDVPLDSGSGTISYAPLGRLPSSISTGLPRISCFQYFFGWSYGSFRIGFFASSGSPAVACRLVSLHPPVKFGRHWVFHHWLDARAFQGSRRRLKSGHAPQLAEPGDLGLLMNWTSSNFGLPRTNTLSRAPLQIQAIQSFRYQWDHSASSSIVDAAAFTIYTNPRRKGSEPAEP